MALQFINSALQGARGISNLKTLLLGRGPVGAALLGASQAPPFIEAGRRNPTGSARLSILGSTGSNLAGEAATRPKPRKTEGYSSYGTYTVGGIEYDINSGRPTYMPPGSVYPSNSVAPFIPAAERAYQQEKSRVAQQTAQNPELQRYENSRLKAVAPGATPEQVQSAEDIGMQIWRQKYGATPMGQTGGAVGSFNPLMDRTFGYQAGMAPDQLAEMQRTAAPIPVAPGAVPYQQGDLGTRATLETGYDPAAYGLTPEKIEEMKQKLLQQASK